MPYQIWLCCLILLANVSMAWNVSTRVDAGTSIRLKREVRSDFDTETLVETVVQFLREVSRPRMLPFDQIDPLLIYSWA